MRRIFLLAPLALLAASSTTPRDRIVWRPEVTTLVRTFEITKTQGLEEVQVLVEGDPSPHPASQPERLDITTHIRYEFVDEVLATDAQRATHVRRSFAEVGGKIGTDNAQVIGQGKQVSDLQGETVEFLWDDKTQSYARTYAEPRGENRPDADLLSALIEDATLRRFLPKGEVLEDDSWQVEVDAVLDLDRPGGWLRLYSENHPRAEVAEQAQRFEHALEGDVNATYKGVRWLEGIRVAVIELAIEVHSDSEGVLDTEHAMGAHQSTTQQRTIEGRIFWNLDAGRLHAFEGKGSAQERNETSHMMDLPNGKEQKMTTRLLHSSQTLYSFKLEER